MTLKTKNKKSKTIIKQKKPHLSHTLACKPRLQSCKNRTDTKLLSQAVTDSQLGRRLCSTGT